MSFRAEHVIPSGACHSERSMSFRAERGIAVVPVEGFVLLPGWVRKGLPPIEPISPMPQTPRSKVAGREHEHGHRAASTPSILRQASRGEGTDEGMRG